MTWRLTSASLVRPSRTAAGSPASRRAASAATATILRIMCMRKDWPTTSSLTHSAPSAASPDGYVGSSAVNDTMKRCAAMSVGLSLFVKLWYLRVPT